jgi:hypothetical protein
MSKAFVEGARAFDEGRYFEAHEHWEDDWRIEPSPSRKRLLQGLVQVAAALHKHRDKGAEGPAKSLFAKALEKLDRCDETPEFPGLRRFVEETRAYAEALARDSPSLAAPRVDLRA